MTITIETENESVSAESYPELEGESPTDLEKDVRYAIMADADHLISSYKGTGEIDLENAPTLQETLDKWANDNEEVIDVIRTELPVAGDYLQGELEAVIEEFEDYHELTPDGIVRRIEDALARLIDRENISFEILENSPDCDDLEEASELERGFCKAVEALGTSERGDALQTDMPVLTIQTTDIAGVVPFVSRGDLFTCTCQDKHSRNTDHIWSPVCYHEIIALIAMGTHRDDLPTVQTGGKTFLPVGGGA